MKISLHYLPFLFCLTIACSGLEKTNTPEVQQAETTIEATDTLPIPNPNAMPLFFEGQIAHWVRQVFQDKWGNLWFGTNHYGAIRYDGKEMTYCMPAQGFGSTRVNGIVADKKGNVWFATGNGLTKYDGKTFHNYDPLPNDEDERNKEAWSIEINQEGTIWFGTLNGLMRFDGEKFATVELPKLVVEDTTSILSYNRVAAIMEDRNGLLWIGVDGFGICQYDGENFTHITKKDGLPDNNVADLLEDKKGNVWIGTMFGGVSRYDGTTFTNFTQEGVVKGVEVYALYEDKAGNVWFGAEHEGVYRYDGKTFTNFYEKDGLETGGIISMLEDKEGRFWLGGWKGLFRYDGTSFFPITKTDLGGKR